MRIEDEHPMISIYSYLANYKDDLEDKDEVGLNESETIKEHAKKIQLLCKEILAINTEKHAETTKRYILKALKQIEENDENKSKQDTKGSKHKLGLDKRKLLVKKGVVGRKEEVRKDTSNNAKTDNTSEEENKEHKAEESQMRAPEGKEFRLANGELITSINELVEKLEQMNDETFFQHIHENNEKMRNDFALWLRDVFDMEEDFSILNQTKDKAQFLEKIRKRI